MPKSAWKPSKEQLAAAYGKRVPDVIGPRLKVLFCGINPGLYSGAVGHHFARPGNRFWPALWQAGFTPRLVSPFEEQELPAYGCGVTNLVARATARADELSNDDFERGARRLHRKVAKYRPSVVAFVGIGAYRKAYGRSAVEPGPQEHTIAGTPVWVLPNTSGLNAHYQLPELVRLFRRLRCTVD